jgi:hypothetical protein
MHFGSHYWGTAGRIVYLCWHGVLIVSESEAESLNKVAVVLRICGNANGYAGMRFFYQKDNVVVPF